MPVFGKLNGNGPFKILNISVHPVLEYDQLGIFEGLGHDIFSVGFYSDRSSDNGVRPKLTNSPWHQEIGASFHHLGCRGDNPGSSRWKLSAAFVQQFDIVIVDHDIDFINDSLDELAGMPVVWRTIGQDSERTEQIARRLIPMGMKVARWSPVQTQLENYAGGDAFIRASADPDVWKGWTGKSRRIVTFNNDFQQRSESLNLPFWQQAITDLPVDLYGLRNDGLPIWRGTASFDEQREILANSRAAFITGTSPAPYTLGFIEAWMTGIPVIHIARDCAPKGTFEIDTLIENGVNGFIAQTPEEARSIMTRLLDDYDLAQRVSVAGRQAAIDTFGLSKISSQWDYFLKSVSV